MLGKVTNFQVWVALRLRKGQKANVEQTDRRTKDKVVLSAAFATKDFERKK